MVRGQHIVTTMGKLRQNPARNNEMATLIFFSTTRVCKTAKRGAYAINV